MTTLKRRFAEQMVKDSLVEGDVITYQIRPYTLVELYAEFGDRIYRGVGMARQGKHDTWNSVLGYEIAYGRAVKEIIKNAKLIQNI